jgi:hypothetical protein
MRILMPEEQAVGKIEPAGAMVQFCKPGIAIAPAGQPSATGGADPLQA